MFKKITSFNFLVFIMVSAFLYSCVEEPFIEPVKTPYSLIRVGNFTNSDNITLRINDDIDDESVVITKTIAKNELSEYFEVTSGNRIFTVLNEANDIIYTNPISVISYAQETLLFGGNYQDDANNSVNFRTYVESKVYLPDNQPPVDSSAVHFVNLLSSTSDTISTNGEFIVSKMDSAQTVVDTTATLDTYDNQNYIFEQGPYKIITETDLVSDTVEVPLGSGLIYYILAAGSPDDIQIIIDSNSPLPPQDK